jgi:hypothetical protein
MAAGLHVKRDSPLPGAQQFETWIGQHGVTAIVVDDRAFDRYADLIRGSGWAEVYAGEGVSVWRPPG